MSGETLEERLESELDQGIENLTRVANQIGLDTMTETYRMRTFETSLAAASANVAETYRYLAAYALATARRALDAYRCEVLRAELAYLEQRERSGDDNGS